MLLLLIVGLYRRPGVMDPPGVVRAGPTWAGWGGHLPGWVRPRGGCDGPTPASPVVGLMVVSEPGVKDPAVDSDPPARGRVGRRLIHAAPGGVSRTMLREATPE